MTTKFLQFRGQEARVEFGCVKGDEPFAPVCYELEGVFIGPKLETPVDDVTEEEERSLLDQAGDP